MFAEDVLRKYLWQHGRSIFNRLKIHYVSRGSDGGVITGDSIEKLTKIGMELYNGGTIPYHRITRITLNGEIVFDRISEKKKAKESKRLKENY